ncbi:hypothetical protein ACP70R_044306 [Stipagrostis hirtigluma subsp. patula]
MEACDEDLLFVAVEPFTDDDCVVISLEVRRGKEAFPVGSASISVANIERCIDDRKVASKRLDPLPSDEAAKKADRKALWLEVSAWTPDAAEEPASLPCCPGLPTRPDGWRTLGRGATDGDHHGAHCARPPRVAPGPRRAQWPRSMWLPSVCGGTGAGRAVRASMAGAPDREELDEEGRIWRRQGGRGGGGRGCGGGGRRGVICGIGGRRRVRA